MPSKKTLPPIDKDFLLEFLVRLLNTPSPTGFTSAAVDLLEATLLQFTHLEINHTRKGALLATLPGAHPEVRRGLTAHVDTLGAMVKEIKTSGRLKLSPIGGFAWNTVEGEGCTIFTRSGAAIRGSLLLENASGHVHGEKVGETKRSADSMEVRVDALTGTDQETLALGIGVGDFVAFDSRVEVVNGFVRARHLDDKAGVAAIAAAVKALQDAGLKPAYSTALLFSTYEEVGHGAAAGFPAEMEELVAVDMAATGAGQTSDEFHATLCVKDTGGPYHHGLSQKLRRIAEEHSIAHKVDIYPYYGSDGEAFWRAGGDVAVALIGPGVDASHNYERTHTDALLATAQWIAAYLVQS